MSLNKALEWSWRRWRAFRSWQWRWENGFRRWAWGWWNLNTKSERDLSNGKAKSESKHHHHTVRTQSREKYFETCWALQYFEHICFWNYVRNDKVSWLLSFHCILYVWKCWSIKNTSWWHNSVWIWNFERTYKNIEKW